MTQAALDRCALDPLDLIEQALAVRPLRTVRQGLSESGKAVYRVDLPDGSTVVLRTSDRASTFAFTKSNLQVLRALRLPVQSVLAAGNIDAGGSYIVLNWLPGRDLLHELGEMTRPQMARLAAQVVACQRRVGSLPHASQYGWAPIGRSGNLKKWTDAFGQAASSTDDDGTALGKLRSRLRELRARVEPYFDAVRPVPFLDDLTTKNVLIESGALAGIIDVDFVCYGDPLLSIGATLVSLAADVEAHGRFYGEELIRFWNPTPQEQLALCFYTALWAIGSLQLTDAADHTRAQSLTDAADRWLTVAEEGRSPKAQ